MGTPRSHVPFAQALSRADASSYPRGCVYSSCMSSLLPMPRPRVQLALASQGAFPHPALLLSLPPPGSQLPGAAPSLL